MICYGKRIQSKISTGKRHVEGAQARPGRSVQNPLQVESHRLRSSPQQGAVTTQRRDVDYMGTKWRNTGFFYMGGSGIVNM